jgi:hypothetical protein
MFDAFESTSPQSMRRLAIVSNGEGNLIGTIGSLQHETCHRSREETGNHLQSKEIARLKRDDCSQIINETHLASEAPILRPRVLNADDGRDIV